MLHITLEALGGAAHLCLDSLWSCPAAVGIDQERLPGARRVVAVEEGDAVRASSLDANRDDDRGRSP